MRVITWNRSFKGMHNADDGRDEFDNDEWETHATVLDKMLAWEKKLYEEVKVGILWGETHSYHLIFRCFNYPSKTQLSSASFIWLNISISRLCRLVLGWKNTHCA